MIGSLFNNRSLKVMHNAMDAAMLRHDILADNVANVNTPGFKRSDVVFEQPLMAALDGRGFRGRKTRDGHRDLFGLPAQDVVARAVTFRELSMRNDENNVDIDKEMGDLAKTQLHFRAVAQAYMAEGGKVSNMIQKAGRV